MTTNTAHDRIANTLGIPLNTARGLLETMAEGVYVSCTISEFAADLLDAYPALKRGYGISSAPDRWDIVYVKGSRQDPDRVAPDPAQPDRVVCTDGCLYSVRKVYRDGDGIITSVRLFDLYNGDVLTVQDAEIALYLFPGETLTLGMVAEAFGEDHTFSIDLNTGQVML